MTTEEQLEMLFAKVRALPKGRRELAVETLSELTGEYELSDAERRFLSLRSLAPSAGGSRPTPKSTRC